MRDWIKNTWQKITNSSLAGRILVVVIVLVVLAAAMILSGPKPPGDFDPLATPTPVAITAGTTATVPPPILSSEYKLTNGVVLAVVCVLVIVMIGTILHIHGHNKKNRG